MSDIYFCFSDECGDYKPQMPQEQIAGHPFYIRTTLLINANEWKSLNNNFRELKNKYSIPLSKELKWAHLWKLRNFQINNQVIPNRYDIKYLENFDYQTLIKFIEEVLSLINGLNEKKIIVTYTKNAADLLFNEKSILAFHLQEHMQRIEMELEGDDGNLGVLFFDPVSNAKNKLFREVYYDLFQNGDYIKRYKSIKDSLNIENSHHSVGIQIADYISGSFSSVLKASDKNYYQIGVKLFYDYVYPNLRRDRNGEIQGYGIREVPSSDAVREWFNEQMKSNLQRRNK